MKMKLLIGVSAISVLAGGAFAQVPSPEEAKGVLDIGTIAAYGPIFFGLILGAVLVYILQGYGKLPVPTKAVKVLQDEVKKLREDHAEELVARDQRYETERQKRQELEIKFAVMEERLSAYEQFNPKSA